MAAAESSGVLPANGGLLTAIAMIAAGWDGMSRLIEQDHTESKSDALRAGAVTRCVSVGKWTITSERILPCV